MSHRYLKLITVFCLLLSATTASAIDRTQRIDIKKGWNAVYVQVDSGEQTLNDVFQDTPFDLVATHYNAITSAEYISDPSEKTLNQDAWHKWIAPAREDAFLTNLHRLEAGRGYLILSTKDYTWNLTGTVRLYKTRWQPDGYTLTGFPVTAIAPGINQLMDISDVHKDQPIYTLETKEGIARWQKVEDRVSTAIQQNKAYWMYTSGSGENFTGAIEVKLSDSHSRSDLNFYNIVKTKKIILRNASDRERQVSLTLVNNQVPLTVRERDSETQLRRYRPVTESLLDEPLIIQPGEEVEIALGIDRKKIADNTEVEGLIKVTDDIGGYNSGGEYWIPVKASGVIR